MAVLSSFGISVILSGSVANPINSATFQVVAPWGMSAKCVSLSEAIADVFLGKAGNINAGKMGQYFSAQTLNGATSSSPPVPYTSANEIGQY